MALPALLAQWIKTLCSAALLHRQNASLWCSPSPSLTILYSLVFILVFLLPIIFIRRDKIEIILLLTAFWTSFWQFGNETDL